MRYKLKYKDILNKLEKKILTNQINHTFTDINILISKFLVDSIKVIESTKSNKKVLLIQIEEFLNSSNEILHYTNTNDLTLLSKMVLLDIYKIHGFEGCINYYLIKQYYKKINKNYNLFFNQVEEIKDIMVNDNLQEIDGKAITINKIDDISINIYLDTLQT